MSRRSVSPGTDSKSLATLWLTLLSSALLLPSMTLSQLPVSPSVFVGRIGDVPLGQTVDVPIFWTPGDSTNTIGGFDLFITHDRYALTFQSAEPGQLLMDCGWEYFTYRTSSWPTLEPHGFWADVIRIVAIAETNNGANHPSCYGDSPGNLAVLNFVVTSDTAYGCYFFPLSFFWTDCSDNIFSSKFGDTLLVSRQVFDFLGTRIDSSTAFPTYLGANDGCIVQNAVRMVDYYAGGVDIRCIDSLDDRGDINLNGLSYEVADWFHFVNYFIYGDSVFSLQPDRQVAATDINADGLVLTLDDLVYLWRIIIGDALLFPRPPTGPAGTATFTQDFLTKSVSVAYTDSLTAASIVFRSDIGLPMTPISEIDYLMYEFDGDYTRSLLFPALVTTDPPPIFAPGILLTYNGFGILEQAVTSDYGIVPINTAITYVGSPGAKAVMLPDTISAYWALTGDTATVTVVFGDFEGRQISEIEHSTVHIDAILPPESMTVLPGWPGFTGSVISATVSVDDFVRLSGLSYKSGDVTFVVSGEFVDQAPFAAIGQITISGLISGDADFNGILDVSDLTFLVAYLFQGGATPPAVGTADVDHNGKFNIADVVALVELLF
ncbi:MAG TPA: hypothetical protein VN285_02610 [Candidatus Deferrimicrobium sp.]|nr:hypothetical protein [Candidatus Deferrimicrobium sp.]